MPEAESELVAGYMTEYSGFRWALYFLAEYTNMIVVASIATTLFLGGVAAAVLRARRMLRFSGLPAGAADAAGRRVLLLPRAEAAGRGAEGLHGGGGAAVRRSGAAAGGVRSPRPEGSLLAAVKPGLHGGFWFLFKVAAYLYVFMWLRFTFPRYRFDQLMRLGWQFLLPVAMANVAGIAVALALHRGLGWSVVPCVRR